MSPQSMNRLHIILRNKCCENLMIWTLCYRAFFWTWEDVVSAVCFSIYIRLMTWTLCYLAFFFLNVNTGTPNGDLSLSASGYVITVNHGWWELDICTKSWWRGRKINRCHNNSPTRWMVTSQWFVVSFFEKTTNDCLSLYNHLFNQVCCLYLVGY